MSDQPDAVPRSTAPERRVRVALLAVDDDGLVGALDAIDRQVYGIEGVVVVDPDGVITTPHGRETVDDFTAFVAGVSQDVELVWILHGDAQPRPDALGALVEELDRNDASLAGSKVIDASAPDRLESVGSASDVFGEPYSGLDPDEVDLEQYDVVRDVAFVSAVSMVVRRDLLRGLRGIDPRLAPIAAGMDFSQRARVAGGRVMVVPSSEVLHHRTCNEEVAGWRETAGRMRSMLKAYRLVTLAWVVPVGTLVGIVDAVVRLALGTTRPLADLTRAGLWNVAHLPGSLAARGAVRATRQVGDEELFRYQVSGSVRMRTLVADVGERFGWVIDDEPGVVTEEEMEDDATAAGPLVAALALVLVALATRRFWAGSPPQVGYSFPIVDVPGAISGFAGGWNPSGLGSPDPVHPSAALLAGLGWILGGWSGAVALAAGVSFLAAVLGTGRLLRELGVAGPTRHLAAIVAVVGTAAAAFATSADLGGLLVIGPTLVVLALCVAPWPAQTRARLVRLAGLVLASSVASMLAPLVPAVILVAMLGLWALVPGVRAGAAVRGLFAADVGVLVASPYLLAVSFSKMVDTGPRYDLLPPVVEGTLVLAAVVLGVAFLPGVRSRIVAAGGSLLAIAVVIGSIDPLRGDLGGAVSVLAALGVTLTVGAALGFDSQASGGTLIGRAAVSVVSGALVVLALAHVVDGRAGFPEDRWSDLLAFTASIDDEAAARVLVVGAPETLPGESRALDDFSYRVVPVEGPGLESARLGQPRLGDEALREVIESVADGSLVRPGEALAEFGVGWVVTVDAPGFSDAMTAQVDMDEVPLREGLVVFRSSLPAPRAVASSGAVWESAGTTLVGRAEPGTVRIADNASAGWAPDWEQDEWASRVSASDGEARYVPSALRRGIAWAGLVLAAVSVVVVVGGRGLRT